MIVSAVLPVVQIPQKLPGIFMPWCSKHFRDFTLFDDIPILHYSHPLGYILYKTEIMGNEQYSCTCLFLYVSQQMKYLVLSFFIKGSRRLIGKENIRFTCQSDGNDYTLPHTSRKLIWSLIISFLRIINSDGFHKLDSTFPGLSPVHTFVLPNHFCYLLSHGKSRIKGGHGILENHSDSASPAALHLLFCKRHKISVVQHYLSILNASSFAEYPQHAFAKHCLAASGLSHKCKSFAAVQPQRNSFHSSQHTLRCLKCHF